MSVKSQAIGSVLNLYLSSRPAKHALHSVGRVLRGGRRRARLYYRADDPYSHLLVQAAPRLVSAYGLEIEIIPVDEPGTGANPAPTRAKASPRRHRRRRGAHAGLVAALGIDDPWCRRRCLARRGVHLTELGLWGVPSLRIGSFSTWGQDRVPLIEAEIARLSKAA